MPVSTRILLTYHSYTGEVPAFDDVAVKLIVEFSQDEELMLNLKQLRSLRQKARGET